MSRAGATRECVANSTCWTLRKGRREWMSNEALRQPPRAAISVAKRSDPTGRGQTRTDASTWSEPLCGLRWTSGHPFDFPGGQDDPG
jgi:hypothetical protein